MDSSDWEQQLLALRALTASTGTLHEAQLLQLRQWGAIAFHGLGEWVAEPDTSTRTVAYSLKQKKRLPKNMPKLVAALDRSVHWLLGQNWALTITQSGKLLYEGDRVASNVAEERVARASGRKGKAASK